jgi:hypothetical protein
MAIWRGAGGSGDATTDAANEASVASTKAAEAEASASAAASSAASAAGSATSASNDATSTAADVISAAASALAASNSETAAATSETNANTSAANAAISETNAATSATSASTAQTAAETAQTAAEAAQALTEAAKDSTLAAFDSFDDRYLGAKSSDPTTDNDGDPLQSGMLYFNTVSGVMNVYDGSAWVAAYVSAAGVLIAANNLSDLTSTTTARSNLGVVIGTDVQAHSAVLDATTASYTTAEETKLAGIETGATADQTASEIMTAIQTVDGTGSGLDADLLDGIDSTGFATAAQGTLAASATQPGDNVSTLTNDAGYLTAETNDLTAAVTWANVPDANITQSSVTQHQAALSVTESQISDLGTYVVETSATGSAEIPSGTTAQRDGTPAAGYLRFNTTDSSFEGYDGSAWGAIGGGGGATGGGGDQVFYENGQTITTSYTLTTNTNAMSTGPLTVNSGVSVTVPSGSRWVVL